MDYLGTLVNHQDYYLFSDISIQFYISDIIVNEFKFKLQFDTLDSDILTIDESYNKSNGSCFWVAETVVNADDDYYYSYIQQKQKILGTTAVRNLKQFELTCELKRMYCVILDD